jgi:hypothetical protein
LTGYRKIVCIIFVALAIVILFLGVRFGLWQFSDITPYILAGLIGGIPPALFYIFKPSNNIATKLRPQLRYSGKQIRVKRWDDSTGGTTFHYSDYYLTIKNTANGIEAKECKGKITVSDTDIEKRQMLWESGKPSIAIGHEELLRLFEISETSERKTILFHRNRLEYNKDMDGKKISVKIQSENAICPSDAYESTVGDVIKNAS